MRIYFTGSSGGCCFATEQHPGRPVAARRYLRHRLYLLQNSGPSGEILEGAPILNRWAHAVLRIAAFSTRLTATSF